MRTHEKKLLPNFCTLLLPMQNKTRENLQKKLNFETHVIFVKLFLKRNYSDQLEEEEHEIFSRGRRAI
jgi:hypothetical protein